MKDKGLVVLTRDLRRMPAEQFQAALNSSSFFDHEQGLFFTLSLLGFADFLLVSRAEILLAAVKADRELFVDIILRDGAVDVNFSEARLRFIFVFQELIFLNIQKTP